MRTICVLRDDDSPSFAQDLYAICNDAKRFQTALPRLRR